MNTYIFLKFYISGSGLVPVVPNMHSKTEFKKYYSYVFSILQDVNFSSFIVYMAWERMWSILTNQQVFIQTVRNIMP